MMSDMGALNELNPARSLTHHPVVAFTTLQPYLATHEPQFDE